VSEGEAQLFHFVAEGVWGSSKVAGGEDALGGNDGGGVGALRRSGAVVTCGGGDG
jgi:hypothetical protein